MRPRKNLSVDSDWTDVLGAAAVDALGRVENLGAKRMILSVANKRSNVLRVVREFREQLLDRCSLDLFHGLDPGVLLLLIDRFSNLTLRERVDPYLDRVRDFALRPLHFLAATP